MELGAPPGLIASIRDCSSWFVLASERRVSTLLSQPKAMAATASKYRDAQSPSYPLARAE